MENLDKRKVVTDVPEEVMINSSRLQEAFGDDEYEKQAFLGCLEKVKEGKASTKAEKGSDGKMSAVAIYDNETGERLYFSDNVKVDKLLTEVIMMNDLNGAAVGKDDKPL